MSKKTAKTANAKTAKTANVNEQREAIRNEFNADVQRLRERVEALAAVNVTELDISARAAHKEQMVKAEHAYKRISRMARALSDDAYSDACIALDVTLEKVHSLAIYAQDKLHQTISAIARNVPLSVTAGRGHANMSTQAVIQLLMERPRTNKELVHDMASITHKPDGTRSSQASSSRRMLEILGMVDFDTMTKRYSLNERGLEYAELLSK